MDQKPESDLSVKSIHVQRLFSMYNHDIVLKPEHATIVFGRNGVGKTALFKLTHALLGTSTVSAADLLRYPFEIFQIVLSNGDRIEATKQHSPVPERQQQTLLTSSDQNDESNRQELKKNQVDLKYVASDGTEKKTVLLSMQAILKQAEQIEQRSPIHQIASDRWIDPETEETLDAFEVVERWGPLVSGESRELSSWYEFLKANQAPQTLFIQAQRLIQVAKARNRPYRGERSAIRETVLEYSADLKKRIDQTLAEYGREAQRRDQTYPQRLLAEASGGKLLDAKEIRASLEKMQQQQRKYQELGILGEEKQAPTTNKQDEAQQGGDLYLTAMTLYVRDTQEKLQIIDQLAQRIQLMLALIQEKFSNKELKIDEKTHDLMVKSTVGDHQPLSVNALSSGEQHQLVLAYDLLFRTRANTLVLIDEPELSLHVEWQERFLSDLKEVIDLVHFDALLATHSPYIINGHDELLIGLSVKAV